jgi:Uma2 family endonuclease
VGIPLLVVEVLSPSTVRRDRDRKTGIYLRAGVREVWLVDPDAGTVEVHTEGGVERQAGESRASSVVLPGFTLAWSDLAT